MQEFWRMGGYGAYVWSSYAIVFVGMAYVALKARWQGKRLKKLLQEEFAE